MFNLTNNIIMGLNCGCPAAAALKDLSIAECKESFGQIQKVLIMRLNKTAGTPNTIPAESIKAKTKMAALLAATDGTKVIVSPYIQNPTTEPGEARTFGGGNQTLGGVEIVIGREPTNFTGVIYQEQQSTIKTLKSYSCEKIGVMLIDENGNIGALTTDSGANYKPIPVDKFFVGDKNLGGYEEPDSNTISWSFLPNWSDDLVLVKASELDYNPLSELANVGDSGGSSSSKDDENVSL